MCNQHRDFFLPVEEQQLKMTVYITKILIQIKEYLRIECEKLDIEGFRKKSIEVYKSYFEEDEKFYHIIEYENTLINCCLESWVRKIVPIIKELITVEEADFWRSTKPMVCENILNLDLDNWLDE